MHFTWYIMKTNFFADLALHALRMEKCFVHLKCTTKTEMVRNAQFKSISTALTWMWSPVILPLHIWHLSADFMKHWEKKNCSGMVQHTMKIVMIMALVLMNIITIELMAMLDPVATCSLSASVEILPNLDPVNCSFVPIVQSVSSKNKVPGSDYE